VSSWRIVFTGALPWYLGLILGLAAGVVLFLAYRGEARRSESRWARWILPLLRCTALLLLLAALTEPVLRHRHREGKIGRVYFLVDGSQSMGLTDEHLRPGRKLLCALARGDVSEGEVDLTAHKAARILAASERVLAGEETKRAIVPKGRRTRAVRQAVARVGELLGKLSPSDIPALRIDSGTVAPGALPQLKARFERELLIPARSLGSASAAGTLASQLMEKRRVEALRSALLRWQSVFEEIFSFGVKRRIEAGEGRVLRALRNFDGCTRWARASFLLCDPKRGILPVLKQTHLLDVGMLKGKAVRWLWRSEESEESPSGLPGEPDGKVTNLADPLASLAENAAPRSAIVLLSDGRHNDGPSPLKAAELLGTRRIPLYTIGFGNDRRVPDLAIERIDGPTSIFSEDRVLGEIVVRDTMPAGRPFSVVLSSQGMELWKGRFTTTGAGIRRLRFDLSLKELGDKLRSGARYGVELQAAPVRIHGVVKGPLEEARGDNNECDYWLRVVLHGRRVLILDGRPRWETRFVRNLFGRNPHWKVSCLIADLYSDQKGWSTDEGPARFPAQKRELFAYGLLILGDVPPDMFKARELQWIREFVEKRGGGLIILDGRRSVLRAYADSPLAPLFPVSFQDPPNAKKILHLQLTGAGERIAAFSLSEQTDRNRLLWRLLPPPHATARVKALPGAETLFEAVIEGGERLPVAVYRRFGCGKVLYIGNDELWRWRFSVADLYHTRFWEQVASWIMEAPFAVRDRYVSLDAGGPVYQEGDSAVIRARIRDESGKPLIGAAAEAILFYEGKKIATVKLDPDPEGGGLYLAATGPLQPGSYQVAVRVKELPDVAMKARTGFVVEERKRPEAAYLTCNENLLREMAKRSGGRYLREEEARKVVEYLKPLSEGKIVVTEIPLVHSFAWFIPFMLLLTLEWLLRKRAGLL